MIAHPLRPSPDPRALWRPLCAGAGIKNTGSGELGTIGLIATSDGTDRWMVSCYHVLGRPYEQATPRPWVPGDAAHQPDESHGLPPIGIVAASDFRAVPERTFDIAAVRLDPSIQTTNALLGVAGIAAIAGVDQPRLGMRVIKCGRTTGVTLGRVVEVRTHPLGGSVVEVDFDDDEDADRLTAPGDSGAVWVDRTTGMAIALHQGATWYGSSRAIGLPEALGKLMLSIAG